LTAAWHILFFAQESLIIYLRKFIFDTVKNNATVAYLGTHYSVADKMIVDALGPIGQSDIALGHVY
jgi:hypothetical protein